MATKQEDRYASVKDFQEAIRAYQAHSESLVLTAHANLNLQKARESGDYPLFARALYGFQESLKLWDANDRARIAAGRNAARLRQVRAATKATSTSAASLLGRAQSEACGDCWPRSTWPAPSATPASGGLQPAKQAVAALVAAVVAIVTIVVVLSSEPAAQSRGRAPRKTRSSSASDRRRGQKSSDDEQRKEAERQKEAAD